MRKGFFRIFVVLSVILVLFSGFFAFEPVANNIYYAQKRSVAQKIKLTIDSSTAPMDYKQVINKLQGLGYEDIDILFYLYMYRNFADANVDGLTNPFNDYSKKKALYDHLGIKGAVWPTSYFNQAWGASYANAFIILFVRVVLPLLLLWLVFYTTVWVARGFKNQ